MKIYILVQHYEAQPGYSWDYSPFDFVVANTSKKKIEQKKKELERLNGGEYWEEGYDNFTCHYTIEEVDLED